MENNYIRDLFVYLSLNLCINPVSAKCLIRKLQITSNIFAPNSWTVAKSENIDFIKTAVHSAPSPD